jgi:hypothetical protein
MSDDNYVDRFKGDNAKPYVEPKEDDPREFIKGFGTPSPKSILGKIEKAGGQHKKAVE